MLVSAGKSVTFPLSIYFKQSKYKTYEPETESIHVECFLGPNNLWPTDRDVLPRVIVFNSLSFVIHWVTSRHRMTGRGWRHSQAGLDTDLFNLVQNVNWWSISLGSCNNLQLVCLLRSQTPGWEGLRLIELLDLLELLELLGSSHNPMWIFKQPFEDSLAPRGIRCWLSFYNWVIIFLLLSFLDFPTGQVCILIWPCLF